MKQRVGKEIAQRAKNDEIIGVGTGSTVDAAIVALGERIANENLQISVVPTSYQTIWRCESLGLTVLPGHYSGKIDWGFDGADAVDQSGNAIKGKGAALLEEKILAAKCSRYFLIVDESKRASDICAHTAIPVEVVPTARAIAEDALRELGAESIQLRDGLPGKHGPIITERGNIILDAKFRKFEKGLEQKIKSIVGVIESGLFERYAHEILIARQDSTEVISIRS